MPFLKWMVPSEFDVVDLISVCQGIPCFTIVMVSQHLLTTYLSALLLSCSILTISNFSLSLSIFNADYSLLELNKHIIIVIIMIYPN